ncbi:GumK N-terminal domain-containing glycosyltransferase [Pseudoxanthomonas wuyuanensis]
MPAQAPVAVATEGGETGPAKKYLVLSAHDYRTPRRANIHFIADELARRGPTRFFSLRYSWLSRRTSDIRLSLDGKANRVESINGVECFLWKTPLHPFNTRRDWLRPLESLLFRAYAAFPPAVLRQWLAEADVVIFESGLAVEFIALARQLNPHARLIYRASDGLDTINVAQHVKDTFAQVAGELEAVVLVSAAMAEGIPSRGNVYRVGHGVDPELATLGDPSPYGEGLHAVAVGSMLFDPEFFVCASHAFPHVTFHVIGSGRDRMPGYGDNVIVYGEMPHRQTIPYIKHANFGIAPYASEDVPAYLADSSLKLLQYDYFALPAVCPNAVVGGYRSRFGYTPGDGQSIAAAIDAALRAPRIRFRQCLDWPDTVDRVLHPEAYADTKL